MPRPVAQLNPDAGFCTGRLLSPTPTLFLAGGIYCFSTNSEQGFAFPETFDNGLTPATLTVTEFGSNGQELESATFDIELTQPVPEPPTVVLTGMGLMVAGLAIARKSGV